MARQPGKQTWSRWEHDDVFRLRSALGYSQQGLAEALGASVSSVAAWEAGRTLPGRRFCMGLENLKRKAHVAGAGP